MRLWAVALLLCSGSPAEGSDLTLRKAEGAIDLALQAELAGDVRGARAALRVLIYTADGAAESPARLRLERYLEGLEVRAAAFDEFGNSPRAYREALETLEPFGLPRAESVWRKALVEVPGLEAQLRESALKLRFDRVRAYEVAQAERYLAGVLAARSITVASSGTPTHQARLDLDASELSDAGRFVRVTAEGSFLLKKAGSPGEVIGSLSSRRRELRREPEQARQFAVRRVLDDLSRALVVRMWIASLDEIAEEGARAAVTPRRTAPAPR